MANKRHKPGEIVTKLRQVEVLVGQGMARVDAIREVRITEQTYYRWRKQYGGMGTDQLKCMVRPAVARVFDDDVPVCVNVSGLSRVGWFSSQAMMRSARSVST
jgi:putative transposase